MSEQLEACSADRHVLCFAMAITIGEELLVPCECGEKSYPAKRTEGGYILNVKFGNSQRAHTAFRAGTRSAPAPK